MVFDCFLNYFFCDFYTLFNKKEVDKREKV
mgnify:CR=1 FL=1